MAVRNARHFDGLVFGRGPPFEMMNHLSRMGELFDPAVVLVLRIPLKAAGEELRSAGPPRMWKVDKLLILLSDCSNRSR